MLNHHIFFFNIKLKWFKISINKPRERCIFKLTYFDGFSILYVNFLFINSRHRLLLKSSLDPDSINMDPKFYKKLTSNQQEINKSLVFHGTCLLWVAFLPWRTFMNFSKWSLRPFSHIRYSVSILKTVLVQIHADQNHRKLSSNVEELLAGCWWA